MVDYVSNTSVSFSATNVSTGGSSTMYDYTSTYDGRAVGYLMTSYSGKNVYSVINTVYSVYSQHHNVYTQREYNVYTLNGGQ